MKINWAKVFEFLATYGPEILQAVQAVHAKNQTQGK